jgi:hypothetical protein
MESAYPFHPALIDIILDNWTAISTFQGPRSILSLLATLLTELRKKRDSNSIILPRDIDFDDKSVMNSFSRYIKERDFKVWGKEIQVLQSFQANYSSEIQDYTTNILKTIFLASIPLDIPPNGLNLRIIKLMVWKPSEPVVLVEESLKLLINSLRYFHSRSNKFFLSDRLNYNARVHDLKSKYAKEAGTKLKSRIKTLFEKSEIKNFIWPPGPQTIGDNRSLKIILLKTPISDRSIFTDWIQYKGKNRFRMYKNTLIFGIPDISVYDRIIELYQTEFAIEHLMGSLTYTNKEEKSEVIFRFKEQVQEINEGVSYLEKKLYLSFFDGVKRFQINYPNSEIPLSQWLYTELENKDVIVKQIHPKLLAHEFFLNKEKIQLNSLIDQFLKNISLPKTSNEQAIINSIIQGIKNSLFSLIQERKSGFKLLNEDNLNRKDSDALFKSNDLFLVETKNLGTFIDNFKPSFKRKRELEDHKPKMTYELVFDETNVEILSSLQRKVLNQITGLIDLNLHMKITTNGTDDDFKIALIEEIVDQLGGRLILHSEEE